MRHEPKMYFMHIVGVQKRMCHLGEDQSRVPGPATIELKSWSSTGDFRRS